MPWVMYVFAPGFAKDPQKFALAVELTRRHDIRAVVGIACEKELQEGIAAVFPKPALGVINVRPHGPCKDSDVDLAEVEKAVAWMLRD